MAQLAPPPLFQFFDDNGDPLVGGLLYTYAAGTTDPLATYTDSTEESENTNPVVLDADGKCTIWIGTSAYKFVLEDSLGNLQWTRDNVQYIPNGSITTVMLADGSVTTQKIADGAVTVPKMDFTGLTSDDLPNDVIDTQNIADGAVTTAKLSGSNEISFVETSGPVYGDGPTAYPLKPWTAPTLIPIPALPVNGDGVCVRFSKSGKILAVSENNTDMVKLYQRFGTELIQMSPGIADPAASASVGCALSPDSQFLASLYPLGTGSFRIDQKFGNAFAEIRTPSNSIVGQTNGIDFDPSSRYMAIAHNLAPYVSVFKRSDISPAAVYAEYGSVNGQTIASGTSKVVNFESLLEDNVSCVTTGAGWLFSAYRKNIYHFKCGINLGGVSAWGVAGPLQMWAYKNFTKWKRIDTRFYAAGATNEIVAFGAFDVDLDVGDVIQIQVLHGDGNTLTMTTDVTDNFIQISEAPGYDTLSSFTVLSNPSTLPAGDGKCVSFSPDGNYLAVGNASQTYTFTVLSANARAGATYTNNGNVFTVISTISGATTLVTTSPSPPTASGTLIKATGGTGSGSDDATISFSSVTAPSGVTITIYERTGDVFVKVTDPTTLPAGTVNGLSWSPDSLKLTCVHELTPFITTYSRSGATFTAVAAPTDLPAGIGRGCAYNKQGNKLAVAHDSSPFLTIYSVSGTTFTKDADAADIPTGNGTSVDWTPDGQYLAHGQVGSPYLNVFQTIGTYGSDSVTFVEEVDLV